MIGRFFVVGMFMMINLGLAVGMMFAALFLLRPLLVRILSPGQRVALWVVGWISLYSPSFYGLLSLVHILPVTFRDLITGRVKDGGWTTSIPAYLPMDYHGAGVYHLSLPGGAVVPVEIGEGIAGAAALLCLGVLVLGIVFSCRQDRRLKELLRRGEPLGGEEALTKHVLQEEARKIQIRGLFQHLCMSKIQAVPRGIPEILGPHPALLQQLHHHPDVLVVLRDAPDLDQEGWDRVK